MPEQSKTRDLRPLDPTQRALQIILEAMGQAPKADAPAESPKNSHAVDLGRPGGMRGGMARAAFPDFPKHHQIAANSATQRWGKK